MRYRSKVYMSMAIKKGPVNDIYQKKSILLVKQCFGVLKDI